jgi:hypothetical protein
MAVHRGGETAGPQRPGLVGHLFVAEIALDLADAVDPHGALVLGPLGLGDQLLGDRRSGSSQHHKLMMANLSNRQ